MPYVTEEVWQHLYADMPEERAARRRADRRAMADSRMRLQRQRTTAPRTICALLQEIITSIRDARNEAEVEAKRRSQVILVGGAKSTLLQPAGGADRAAGAHRAAAHRAQVGAQAGAGDGVGRRRRRGLSAAGRNAGYRERGGSGWIARSKAQAAIERSQRMLENPNFVARAKPDIVQRERDALAAAEDTLTRLQARRLELAG